MRSWGSIARRARPTSRAPIGAWQKSCIPTPTRTIRRRRRALPSSTLRTKSSRTRTSARRSIAVRSTPTASRGSRVLAPAAPTRVPASAAIPISKVSVLVRKVSPVPPGAGAAAPKPVVAAGSAGASRVFCGEPFGGGPPRGARSSFEPEDFGVGADVQAEMSVSLTDAANGSTQRLHLPNGKDVDVKIPVGIMNGQHIRLKGQGMAGQAGPGDLLIPGSPAPHPIFTLDGADVRLDLPITLYEAALGAKVRVPTLDKPVEITVPAWTSSGRTFRLKGKGFPAKAGRGDLLATIRIVLPEKRDPELDELMKQWQSDKPYDPRKDM